MRIEQRKKRAANIGVFGVGFHNYWSQFDGLRDDLVVLDQRIEELDAEIEAIAKNDPVAKRLQQLRGVGPLTATALVAAVGNGEQFTKDRHLAVSLGLTPKQHSTGGKERLLGIS